MMETEPSDRSIDHRRQNVLEMTEILDLESLIHVEQTYGLLILLKRWKNFFDLSDHQFLWFGISRWLCTWTYTWIDRGESVRSRKGLRDVGGNWILRRFCIDLEGDPQTAVEGRRVGLIVPQSFVIWFFIMTADLTSTSDIYLNIFLNFRASIRPPQTTPLLQLIYLNFYARFGHDTGHFAQLLAFVPDFAPLAKLLKKKHCEIDMHNIRIQTRKLLNESNKKIVRTHNQHVNYPFCTSPHQTTLASPTSAALWHFLLQMCKG